jgi:amino acid transporter
MTKSPVKQLSVFSLVMITVVAVDSLRALPFGAQYGFSIIFYYIIAALAFFIPVAMVAAELATGWPEQGGIYIWVREAFGKKTGFFTVWLQWFYNICWYPTIMTLIAATLAYCFNPKLADDKIFMLTTILSLYWMVTFINFFGMKVSAVLINLAAVLGTIIPIIMIIGLAIVWIVMGKPIQMQVSVSHFFPSLTSINNLVLLTGVVFGLLGMENAAAHAKEVKNPQRDYPRAMLWSTCIILFTLVFGSLAIATIIPQDKLNIITGLLQAYEMFFAKFHLSWFMPVLAMLVVLGALGGLNAWLLSPSKGLLMASRDGCLPEVLCRTNSRGVPTNILIAQGILFTALCSIFLLLPTVSSSYWALSVITSILSLIVYIPMFLAAICLRYKYPHVKRSYRVPGGNTGMWIACLSGLISCVFTMFIGFFPPSQINVGNTLIYEIIIITGVVMSCILPLIVYKFSNKHPELNLVSTE